MLCVNLMARALIMGCHGISRHFYFNGGTTGVEGSQGLLTGVEGSLGLLTGGEGPKSKFK